MSRPSILFLGHGAERTGPPVYLVRVLRWLAAETDVDARVVLLTGGPLLDELRSLAPVVVAHPDHPGPELDAARIELNTWPRPDVVVVNTAGSIRALTLLPEPPNRLVSYVHELATGFDFWLAEDDRARLLADSDLIVAVSDAVAAYLRDEHGVDPSRLRVHRGIVLPEAHGDDVPDPRPTEGIPVDAPFVVASGTLDWRKGPDLFVEVAERVRATDVGRRAQFAWVGGDPTAPAAVAAREQAERAGLADSVHFVGEVPDPSPWFAVADLFLLPSREDAYPLVCLEAAAEHLPIVCFDAGGMPEFVRDDAGIVAPFPDLDALATAVTDLLADSERRERLGATGAARVQAEATPDAVLPALLADLVTGGRV